MTQDESIRQTQLEGHYADSRAIVRLLAIQCRLGIIQATFLASLALATEAPKENVKELADKIVELAKELNSLQGAL